MAESEHPPRGNVGRRGVGVGVEPKPIRVELPLQAERVVADDLTRQEHQRKVAAEAPRLHQVGDVRRERLPAIEPGEIFACVIGDGGAGLRQPRLPLGARGQRLERKVD